MSHPLISRLERHGPLSDEEKDVLREVTSRVRDYGPRQDIVPEGDTLTESCLILEGFACRHNSLADGRRQITAFHVSGDFADLHAFLLKKMDDGVSTLTPCKVALVPHSALREITKTYPHLTRVLWFTTLVDGAVHREWITGLGRLNARAGRDCPILRGWRSSWGRCAAHRARGLAQVRLSHLGSKMGQSTGFGPAKPMPWRTSMLG